MNIRIEGLDRVIRSIEQKFGNAEGKLSKGIAKGCKIVEGEAKANCPVSTEATRPGGPHRSGRYNRSCGNAQGICRICGVWNV